MNNVLQEWGTLTTIRESYVSGLGPWVWRSIDKGTFKLIAEDWEKYHLGAIQNISQRRVAIQAGGNMGMYPRLLSDLFQYVFTFEPEPLNFFCLANNCQRSNILKCQGFLTNDVGFHGFSFPERTSNAGEFGIALNQGFIPSFCVDSFRFNNVDLIWLDIEGSEDLALEGARKTIERCHPVLMIENGDSCKAVKKFLKQMNYIMVDKSARDGIFIHKESAK